MKIDILAIGVHPDDVELSCAGTLIKHQQQGAKIGLLDLTKGELGTRGSGELRLEEAEAARKILKADFRINLGFADGFFTIDQAHYLPIIEVLRKYEPKIVLTNALSDRHPDHGRAAKLTSEACFLSGLVKIKTTGGADRHRPQTLYHYIQDHFLKPDFVVDIEGQFDQKVEAIKAFSSQFYDPKSTELSTPISGEDFWEYLDAKARSFGRWSGVKYGEGFNVARPIRVDNLFDLH